MNLAQARYCAVVQFFMFFWIACRDHTAFVESATPANRCRPINHRDVKSVDYSITLAAPIDRTNRTTIDIPAHITQHQASAGVELGALKDLSYILLSAESIDYTTCLVLSRLSRATSHLGNLIKILFSN